VLAVLALAVAATTAEAALAISQTSDPVLIATYVVAILAELTGALLAIVAYGLVSVWVQIAAGVRGGNDRLSRIESLLEAHDGKLQRLSDLAPLSDQAKALIFRDREIDAVRETIHECLARQDYTQANHLIDRMDKQFGHSSEAQRFRTEVEANREATIDEKINAAIDRVDRIIAQKNWPRALRESERLGEVFPESVKVASLPKRITEARARHKRELLSEYGEAVKRNDVDRSIELLKELDTYLTPQEAAALQESARGVFRAKLHNLGIQFAIAVTDEQWASALKTGEEIVREFPNTRMATEVRQKLDTLRQRAGTADTPATGR
jgi:hypothetical protein